MPAQHHGWSRRGGATVFFARFTATRTSKARCSPEQLDNINIYIKITKYKSGNDSPETTVTIPLTIFKIAAKILPQKALDALQETDIDIEQLQKLSENPDIEGTILEAENNVKRVKIIISIE